MSDQTLRAVPALDNFSQTIGATRIREITPVTIVSIATPMGGHEKLDALLEKTTGLQLPAIGKINRHEESLAVLGLQTDQCFMVSFSEQLDPANTLQSLLGGAGYLSDQSDSWVVLEIDGPLSRSALERICPLNLAANVFTQDSVARTSMEHLSVIIEHPSAHCFRLYSPRSSARSFLHAIALSLSNVLEE